MKRLAAALALILCGFVISGCSSGLPNDSESSGESRSASSERPISEVKWTVPEIQALFDRTNSNPNWTVLDCAAVWDDAFDCVGVVLYTDSVRQTCNVAFMDQDGHCQRCGVYAEPWANSSLAYCGAGTVTFYLESEDGAPYQCKIAFSVEDGDVNFVVESD